MAKKSPKIDSTAAAAPAAEAPGAAPDGAEASTDAAAFVSADAVPGFDTPSADLAAPSAAAPTTDDAGHGFDAGDEGNDQPDAASDVVARIGPSEPITPTAPIDLTHDADDRQRLAQVNARLLELSDPIAWRNEPLRMKQSLQQVFNAQKADFDKAIAKLDDDYQDRFARCQVMLKEKSDLEREAARLNRSIGSSS